MEDTQDKTGAGEDAYELYDGLAFGEAGSATLSGASKTPGDKEVIFTDEQRFRYVSESTESDGTLHIIIEEV